ncbi:hypothetical protein NP493_817g02058 [Ridgeia piscesae]|uniref:Uncharacterized protein n=1 Tax=Ridgeia piscesae TaxID=27915 RepID=A0AAD9KMX5_RIDPI|nr:hypothetical protein NP493_817g02058 [Ridgeia piscesae]
MTYPVNRRFFLIRRSSIDGSPVHSRMSFFQVVCHFVHPGYPHDRTQMPRIRIGGWTARLHGISCL